MRSWDGSMTIDSSAAAIVSAARREFWPMLLQPKVGSDWQVYEWPESGFAQEEILMHAPPRRDDPHGRGRTGSRQHAGSRSR